MTDLHTELDETHNPSRRSWVETANAPDAAFPIQNLPLGMFSPSGGSPRAVGAISVPNFVGAGVAGTVWLLGDNPGDFDQSHTQGGELGCGERLGFGDGIAHCQHREWNNLGLTVQWLG